MMKRRALAAVICFLVCAGCTARYQVRIQTVPKTECEIFIDKTDFGSTSAEGTAVVTSKPKSTSVPVLLEVKGEQGEYGSLAMDYDCDALETKNVAAVSCKCSTMQCYSVTFLFDSAYINEVPGKMPLPGKKPEAVYKPNPRPAEPDTVTQYANLPDQEHHFPWGVVVSLALFLVNVLWLWPMMNKGHY